MSKNAVYEGYDAITSNQSVISSSLAGLDWYGDVVDVEVDEAEGLVIVNEELTRDMFFHILRKVARPS